MPSPDAALESLGYPLDRVPKPGAIYKPVMIDGSIAYVSGAVPFDGDEVKYRGKVPTDVDMETAKKAAALCAANSLRMARAALGSLDRVERVIRLTGYVNSDADFSDQHLVMNGASELLRDVFGEDHGIGARSAIGVANLPLNSTVEIDLMLKLKP